MPIFTDIPPWLNWAVPELDEAFRLGVTHGVAPGIFFPPRPPDVRDADWDARCFDMARTVCIALRAAQPWSAVVRLRLPSVLRISGVGVGTAYAVGYRNGQAVMLTNAHCVQDERGERFAGHAQKVTDLQARINSPLPFNIVDISPLGDYALITCPWRDLPAIPLTAEEPRLGEWLVGIGCGAGIPGRCMPFMSGPRVEATANGVKQPLMADSAVVQEGDSGGPVLNMRGDLVGMITTFLPGASMDQVIPRDVLRAYLGRMGVAP